MKGKFDPYVLWPLALDLGPLNSRPVYCSRLYGIHYEWIFVSQTSWSLFVECNTANPPKKGWLRCSSHKGAYIIYDFLTRLTWLIHTSVLPSIWNPDKILAPTGLLGKVIHTKYSKHRPSTVAHTFECVCSKINHGLNHGLFISLLKLINCPIHWIVYE